MNTTSYPCTLKEPANFEDLDAGVIGDFLWLRDQGRVTCLIINAPAADGKRRGSVAVPVKEGPNAPGDYWGWDGNIEKPTLTPSIHWIGHWHGFLRNGRLESC